MITISRCSTYSVKALTLAIASVVSGAALADASGAAAAASSAQVNPALQSAFASSMSSVVSSKVNAAQAIRAQMAGPIMSWFAPKPAKTAVNAPNPQRPGADTGVAPARVQPQDSGNSAPSGTLAPPVSAAAEPAAAPAPTVATTPSPPVAKSATADPIPAPAGAPPEGMSTAAVADADAVPTAMPAGGTPTMHSDYVQSPVEQTPTPVYAGLAYEVHWLRADGARVPVDPRAHHFRNDDRFVVPFRPTLPGIVDVYNVDPNGVTTKIDSQRMAAGQLLVLGTYRFVKESGPETLRLVLTPCGSPELLAATRSIVRTEEFPRSEPVAPLQSCAVASTRPNQRTRAIERVAAEGQTAYALDAASSEESRTGQFDAREITIRFQHE